MILSDAAAFGYRRWRKFAFIRTGERCSPLRSQKNGKFVFRAQGHKNGSDLGAVFYLFKGIFEIRFQVIYSVIIKRGGHSRPIEKFKEVKLAGKLDHLHIFIQAVALLLIL